MNNFGLRLKALIEHKGLSVEEFWPRFGISRATLYNWLKRDKPPPSKEHRKNLAAFFHVSPEYLLQGQPAKMDMSKIGPALAGSSSSEAGVIKAELEQYIAELIQQTGGQPSRLGWLLEQLRSNVRVPDHWSEATQGTDLHHQVIAEVLEKERREDLRAARRRAHSKSPKAQGGAGR